jgi:hypothetical protein
MILKSLEPGEHVIIEVRRHWFVFALQLVGLGLMALLPIALTVIIKNLTLVFFLWSLWLIIIWVLAFSRWLHYYLDVWIITNKRLVDFEFKGLFNYETSSMRLDRIQDITVEVSGILANIFKFGTLHVQTAGEVSNTFVIVNAAHPERVKQILFDQYNQVMDSKSSN